MTTPFAPYQSPMIDPATGLVTPLWSAFFDQFIHDTTTGGTPTGGVMLYEGDKEPDGWVFCDGRELSRTKYKTLFGVIGTRYGPGDGTSTFNIPDRRNKFLKGASALGIVEQGGSDTYLVDVAHLPVITIDITDPGHTHTFVGEATAVPLVDPGHTHTITDPGHDHSGGVTTNALGPVAATTTGLVTAATGAATTGVTVDAAFTGVTAPDITPLGHNEVATTGITAQLTGGAQALTIEPPYLSIGFIIKY